MQGNVTSRHLYSSHVPYITNLHHVRYVQGGIHMSGPSLGYYCCVMHLHTTAPLKAWVSGFKAVCSDLLICINSHSADNVALYRPVLMSNVFKVDGIIKVFGLNIDEHFQKLFFLFYHEPHFNLLV